MHCEVEPPCTRLQVRRFSGIAFLICTLIMLMAMARLARHVDELIDENARLRTQQSTPASYNPILSSGLIGLPSTAP
jgi:hypothetical protein